MALKTKVKVGSITNLSDARYCAGMGVDLLGFPVQEIDFKTYQDITGWVTGPQFVIELNTETTDISSIIEQYSPDYIEIEPSHLTMIQNDAELKYIVRLPISSYKEHQSSLLKHKDQIEYLLLTESSGDIKHDSSLIQTISTAFKVFIGYDLTEETLHEILQLPIEGISLQGSDELKPGLKDYDHLSTILELLED